MATNKKKTKQQKEAEATAASGVVVGGDNNKKDTTTTAVGPPLTVPEQHAAMMKCFQEDFVDILREASRIAWKQALWGGIGAVIGSLLLVRYMGPVGGIVGGLVGSILGSFFTSDYDQKMKQLAAMDDVKQQERFVRAIAAVLIQSPNGPADYATLVSHPNAISQAFFDVCKRTTVRLDLWRACKDFLEQEEETAARKGVANSVKKKKQ